MTEKELYGLLASVKNTESEIIEFKEWKNNIPFSSLTDSRCVYWYCVWIWNEWWWKLIVWVGNKWEVKWTNAKFQKNPEKWIFDKTWQKISIEEIKTLKWKVFIINIPWRQVWEILKFNWTPLMRVWDSLLTMSDAQMIKILNETKEDWSKKIILDAKIDDLDWDAIMKAREKYLQKNPDKKEILNDWDDKTFLNKAKIIINWKITNTAIILLWKEESEHFISPSVAKISWILKDRDWIEIDYKHFFCPFLLSAEKVFEKIRNLKYRYMNDNNLFPEEVDKYEPYIIRESLNNCIAHQDYELWWKINIVENEDSLIFSNIWDFIPWTIENVISSDSPSEHYRNKFLTNAMVNLNMIDTIWSWIKKMFKIQREKYFPLPDYDFKNNKVLLKIDWKILDLNYARKLALLKKDLSLSDIILLDKIQKKKGVSKEEIKYLKSKKLIEWRSPNFHISLKIAEWTEFAWDYVLQKSNINEQKNKVYDFINLYKKWVPRKKIMEFVLNNNIFEKWLSSKQKEDRWRNILDSLRKEGKVLSVRVWNLYLWKIVVAK